MQELLGLKPKYGLFLKNRGKVLSDKNLVFNLEDNKEDKSTRLLRLRVKNIGKNSININSFLVGEFEISSHGINEILYNGWGQSSFSGYKPLDGYTRKSHFFLKRDQNPFSFRFDYGYLDKSIVNEWYTQLVGEDSAVVIGAVTTKDQYTQVYLNPNGSKLTIRITSQFDGLSLKPGEEVFSETIAIITGSSDSSLEKFGSLLKDLNGVKRLSKPPTGLCCAYYHQGNKVNEQYILEQLEAIDRIPGILGLEYIQIDAGYSPWGDWLDTKEQFPSGMESIVKEIKKRGMKAGIWIAPFVASPNSRLFKEHKEWFLKDDSENDFEARFTSPFDFLPPLQFRVLDVTNPQVKEYLTRVIKQFVDWGFEFIKTDFTYPICFCTNYHKPMTRVQAIREGFETIRKAAGDKIHIMSGITQLSPLVGLIDSVRVGFDTVNPFVYGIPIVDKFVNHWMLTQDLRNCKARQFLNGKVWINDADCLVIKKNSGLSKQVLDRHFQFIKNYGGSRWIGDHLGKLTWDRYEDYVLDLFGFIPSDNPAVSVVVPAYNEEKTIQKTLYSLTKQGTKVPFEIVFVDNNCTDNTADVVKPFFKNLERLKIICETKQGIGAARESGFKNSESEIIASTDADSLVPQDWISKIFDEFWKDKNLIGVVGTYVFESKSKVFNLVSKGIMMFADYIHKLLTGSFAFRGINFAVKKEAWKKAGGFNTKISALEDVDLSLRVGKLGKIRYLSNLVVTTSYRRFEGRFLKQLTKRAKAYFYRVIAKNSEKHTDWEHVR
ncbi:MAG: glycosyltransferase [Patescibacteria group bacterium]